MILLDEVHDDTEGSITCKVTLHADSPFVEDRRVSAVVAVEYMAQCVAAYAGLAAFRQGKPVRIGYVIGARLVEFSVDAYTVGQELLIRASKVWGDDALGNFECSVDAGGRRVATGVLTVYQGDLDDAGMGKAGPP